MTLSKKVTIIICTRNAERTIKETIKSVIKCNTKEIIIVDGNSEDKTLEICSKYNVKILKDDGIGLGNARNVGLNNVTTEYVYYVGPDCILVPNSIDPLIINLNKKNWVGTQPLVSIYDTYNYFLKSINIYRKAKFYPGRRNIIGTPWLYKTSILKKYKFNKTMNYSDDTELCSRLEKDNLLIGISDINCYEIGEDNFIEIFKRWKMYGTSDYDFYKFNKKNWTLKRKIKSLISPLKKDFFIILLSKKINIVDKIFIIYFLTIIVIARYYGWFYSWVTK
tara:strand:- start:3374 stop:4210 length:837 start_codon:yes stop_codon:yes gene_type:complete